MTTEFGDSRREIRKHLNNLQGNQVRKAILNLLDKSNPPVSRELLNELKLAFRRDDRERRKSIGSCRIFINPYSNTDSGLVIPSAHVKRLVDEKWDHYIPLVLEVAFDNVGVANRVDIALAVNHELFDIGLSDQCFNVEYNVDLGFLGTLLALGGYDFRHKRVKGEPAERVVKSMRQVQHYSTLEARFKLAQDHFQNHVLPAYNQKVEGSKNIINDLI